MNTPEERRTPWNWPAEWAVDEKFWREVATRTVAGVFTLIVLGVPSLIYAMSTGVLPTATVVPILIGLGMFVLLLVAYITVLSIIRLSARRRARKVIREDASALGSSAWDKAAEDLIRHLGSIDASRIEITMGLSDRSKSRIKAINRSATLGTAAATLVGLVTGIVAFLAQAQGLR